MKLRLALVAAVATVTTFGLSACGSSDGSDTSAADSTPSVTDTAVPSDTTSSDTAGTDTTPSETAPTDIPSDTAAPSDATSAGSGPGTPIPLSATVHDNALGHTIVFEQVVRNFPVPSAASAMSDHELVLVKVKVTAGTKYYSSVGQGDFEFGIPGVEYAGQQSSATAVTNAMKAAGYTPLADVESGKTGEGWVAGFIKPPGSAKAYIDYHRLSYSTSGGGSIPEKTWKVTLPLS